MARLKDIAERVGVSKVAVSCVLNNRMNNVRVSDAKRQAIQEAAKEMGYVPNLRAKGMAHQKSFAIGMIAPFSRGFSDPFYVTIGNNYAFQALQGVESACREVGYHCIYTSYGMEDFEKLLYPKIMQDASVDGAVLLGYTCTEAVQKLTSFKIPCAQIGSNIDSGCNIDQVYGDLDRGFEEAVQKLAELGHKKVLLYLPGGPGPELLAENFRSLNGKIKGVKTEVVLTSEISGCSEYAYQYARKVVADNDPPTAFICDIINAKGLAEGLGRGGWRCPEDYSLIAFSSSISGLACNTVTEPLSTILIPQYQIGRLATRKLLSKLGAVQLDSEEAELSAVHCKIIYGANAGPNPKTN